MTTYRQYEKDEITALLIGRTVKRVANEYLLLDDGRLLKLTGNEGGCACSAGDYSLTELNDVDNVITNVEFVDNPDNDYDLDRDGLGHYKIFVFADNRKINLATFEGSDGNGYYGTGYSIEVLP